MLRLLVSILPLLAKVAIAVPTSASAATPATTPATVPASAPAPAPAPDAGKKERICFDINPSMAFFTTTVYVTTTTGVLFETSKPTTGTGLPVVPTGLASIPASGSLSGKLPPQPSQGATNGQKWGNGTLSLTNGGAPGPTDTGTGRGVPKPSGPTNNTQKGLINMVYFTNWGTYKPNYQPHNLPASDITHVLYSFGNVTTNGTVVSSDDFADTQKQYRRDGNGTTMQGAIGQLFNIKKKNRKLKTLLSIGGWTYTENGAFKSASTELGRKTFASSAVKLALDWGMDGIDIDWEFPKNETEAKEFVALLKECRDTFDKYIARVQQKYHYLITVAVSAGSTNYKNIDIKGMDQYVDLWNLMAYDYAGSWDNTTGHQANLYPDPTNKENTKVDTEQAINAYIAAGVAPHKILLGLPIYGRSFGNTDGLGKPYKGVGKGSVEDGTWLYKDLPRPGAEVKTDDKVGATWSYDPKAREFVSYDNPQTAALKATYIKTKGLGGAFFWEASGDKNGTESLIGSMARSLGQLDSSENMLVYPESRYDNIKNGKGS